MPEVTLSPAQGNVNTTSTPVYQDWSFAPSGFTIEHYQGAATPGPLTVATVFKDIAGTPAATGYTDLKYRTYVGVANFPTCVVMSGGLYTGTAVYNPYVNGISGDMLYTFQNLDLLSAGTYYVNCHHQIRGVNSSGTLVTLSEATFVITIKVYPSTAPVIIPSSFDFTWTIGQGTLESQAIEVQSTGNWLLRVPYGFAFGIAAGVTVTPLANNAGYEASGTGDANFTLVATLAVEPDVITQNPVQFTMVVNGGILNVPINVTFLTGAGLFIATQELYFEAYKGITVAYPQYVHAYYPGQYDFICPPWLTVLPHPAYYTNNLGFFVLSADNMDGGIYEADVQVVDVDGNILGAVHVVYNVISNINSPYPRNGYAFTLDNNFLEFVSEQDDTFYDVAMAVTVYDFYTGNSSALSINFKVPLHNRKQVLNIGRVVDRMMKRLPDFSTENDAPYLPAEVSLSATEKSNSDPDYTLELDLSNILFIAGLSPVMVNGCGILDFNLLPARVTPKSIAWLNLLVSNFPTLKIFRNDTLINSYVPQAGIRSIKLDFDNLGAVQGDVFEFRLEVAGGQSVSKKYKVFPEGYNSIRILWENEYKLKSELEFTGKKKELKGDFENRTQELQQNLVDVLEKIENTKKATLTLNTGWVLQSDHAAVESLIRAKRAALLMADGTEIKLVPTSKTMVNIDDSTGAIAFDVEFQINPNYNEEIYSL